MRAWRRAGVTFALILLAALCAAAVGFCLGLRFGVSGLLNKMYKADPKATRYLAERVAIRWKR
jgi:ABC-type nitrate/sulfonate/bicarbonate transport system permease component